MFEKYFENAKILQKSSQIIIIKGKSQISHRCLLQENTVTSFIENEYCGLSCFREETAQKTNVQLENGKSLRQSKCSIYSKHLWTA